MRKTRRRQQQPTERIIYLIHFHTPYKHAKHYMGSTDDLTRRLHEHERGNGARLMEVICEAGISWTLARAWQGDRKRERQLKNRGGAARICPLCRRATKEQKQ